MTNERDQKLIEMESENQYLGSWCHLGIKFSSVTRLHSDRLQMEEYSSGNGLG